jgi:hypothetical protein
MIVPIGTEDCLFSTSTGEAAAKAESAAVVMIALNDPMIK